MGATIEAGGSGGGVRSIRGVRLVSARSGPAAELGRLEARLAAFYAADEGYFEFAESLDHSRFYEALRPHIEAAMTERRRLRVLEFGAGRSGFPDWLEAVGLRQRIELTAQDVTALNRDWLAARCEAVLLGDAAEGLAGGPYDLIFSTFVYEHLVRPDRVVEACVSALAPGGLLAIFSPAYVMPGYVPPALRARPRAQGLTVTLFLWLQALKVRLGGRPNFWVAAEPALFERGYFVDADAVHLVAPADLDRLLAGRAVRRPLRLPAQGLADWVWSRFLLLAALYEKR